MDEVMLVKGRVLESTLLAMTSRWWGHQRMLAVVGWLRTKVHYGLLLRHIGWTAERLGQGSEGGVKRMGSTGGREKRWGSSASQWERSETSISLTAACVHSSARLALHIHTILTSWVWSLRSSDSPKVMLFHLEKRLRAWKRERAAACSRPVFPGLSFEFLHANLFVPCKWFVNVKDYSVFLLRKK